MPTKIKPTSKQISMLVIHFIVFAIGSAAMLYLYDPNHGKGPWAYPWPAWTVAAWALCFLGHFCIVFTSTEDKGYADYRQMQGKENN
jgi:hypothetical protein